MGTPIKSSKPHIVVLKKNFGNAVHAIFTPPPPPDTPPPPPPLGGHIVFGVDPIGVIDSVSVGISVAFCMRSNL